MTLEGMPHIPAMTNQTERMLYYRLAKENAGKGAVVELGAWLGASSAYIAAGMRDSGTGERAHVYDRFLSKPNHAEKVKDFHAKHGGEPGDMPVGDCLPQFKQNLGPLLKHLIVHKTEIDGIVWDGGPIALLITDAPKRVPQIASVLSIFGPELRPGALMTWQDFCHFPSYEIPACLSELRDHLEFVEATVPGSTLCFRVKKQWEPSQVTRAALRVVTSWSPDKIAAVWEDWLPVIPEGKRAMFKCGAALFMCDTGNPAEAQRYLGEVVGSASDLEPMLDKWKYIKRTRPDLADRYKPLLEALPC